MIIECPACNSRYRIREDKLPTEGGNIKCPNCAHVFFVNRPGGADPTATQAGRPAAPEQDAAATAESTDAVLEASGDAPAVERWKLRNSVGLVYDFPSVEQLRKWLAARDTFDGLTVSSDAGATWTEVENAAALEGVKPTGRKPVASMPSTATRTGSFQTPNRGPSGSFSIATADDMRREAKARVEAKRSKRPEPGPVSETESKRFELVKPPSNAQEERASKVLLILALLILPVVAAIALHAAGVIDLADYGILPDTDPPAIAAPAVEADDEQDAPAQRVELSAEQQHSMLVTQASNAIARGDSGQAIEYLEAAVGMDDSARELHCQLAALYEEVQRTADAESARARCNGEDAAEAPQEGSGVPAAPADGSGAPNAP